MESGGSCDLPVHSKESVGERTDFKVKSSMEKERGSKVETV